MHWVNQNCSPQCYTQAIMNEDESTKTKPVDDGLALAETSEAQKQSQNENLLNGLLEGLANQQKYFQETFSLALINFHSEAYAAFGHRDPPNMVALAREFMTHPLPFQCRIIKNAKLQHTIYSRVESILRRHHFLGKEAARIFVELNQD